jgi:parallel beta-helix repeat protein
MKNLRNRKSIEAHLPTVTVGPDAGMFRGADHFAIQGAVDYVARLGGGEVQLLPGDYVLRNAILLADGVTLRGCGAGSTLSKASSQKIELASDGNGVGWFVDVQSSEGFGIGDGITISSDLIDGAEGRQHSIHTVVGVEGRRIFLDSQPRMEHWLSGKAIVNSTHSLVELRGARDVAIREIQLRGNRAENDWLDGNYGAAIFMRDSENILVDHVAVADFNGDAISWQTCHDVTVENCVIRDVATLGLHPGTGSQRPIMRCNEIHRCKDGIYFCWNVNHGLAEDNRVFDCAGNGISIGHCDTENIVRGNEVSDCRESGIFFRPERGAEKTAHRTLIEENVVRCPADHAEARGISVVRGVEDVLIRNNKIEIAEQHRENAIVVDEAAVRTVLENNQIKILK